MMLLAFFIVRPPATIIGVGLSLTAQVYAEPLNGQSSHRGRRCRREQHNTTSGVIANNSASANA
jgi:hypothetical protein